MIIFGLKIPKNDRLHLLINGQLLSLRIEDVKHLTKGGGGKERYAVIHDGMKMRLWEQITMCNPKLFFTQTIPIQGLWLEPEDPGVPTLTQCFERAEITPQYKRDDPRFLRDMERLYHGYVQLFV